MLQRAWAHSCGKCMHAGSTHLFKEVALLLHGDVGVSRGCAVASATYCLRLDLQGPLSHLHQVHHVMHQTLHVAR